MISDKIDYPKASKLISDAGFIIYIGGFLLIIAFISPYWWESHDDASTNLEHMGLWTYCFNHTQYPYYQFEKLFDGCNTVFSEEYYVIRDRLLLGWLLVLDVFMSLAVLLSLGTLPIIVAVVTRYPQRLVLKYEYMLSALCFLAAATTTVLILFTVSLFPLYCWIRGLVMYPMYNHLSWSFYIAILSGFVHAYGAWYLFQGSKIAYEQRRKIENLVMQINVFYNQ
ncbi:unnamed protein product [Macrosiphum euphorbiae]|uniref:Uncharacterized protein n=1 Tax=Macrosiphum euphorbiae TaxID=13131 RepID=A0AAV0XUH2_9HEMI|nr:unnamed protein product [Macrosiphum euphorbiae]